jgi:ABC-2 type transport system permease protein
MNWQIIRTLIAKDVSLYFRNTFFAVVTLGVLAASLAIYLLMPDTAEAKFKIAIYPAAVPAAVQKAFTDRTIEVSTFASEAAMRSAVEAGQYRVGIVLPPEAQTAITTGASARITAYYPPGIPENLNRAFNDLLVIVFNDVSYAASNQPLNIKRHEEVLGYDLAGKAISPRDRMLPLFVVALFVMETLGLATLLAEEVERGTVRALLITPMRLRELFVGKSVMGLALALVQAGLLITLTGNLGYQPVLILVALVLGALLITGVGFLIASVARDMMSVLSWGMLAVIVLGIPSVGIMFPGAISDWVRLIPSHYLVDTLHRVLNFNATWGDVSVNLMVLLVLGIAMLALGTLALGRKLR